MTKSETIEALAGALSTAQAAMKGAAKDSTNPHFRAKYADLASVREACWKALTDNGLSVVQSPRLVHSGDAWVVEVETVLLHRSGQFISDVAATPIAKADAQGVGSATTYLRRYALAAFAGIAPEDDDGNEASREPEIDHGYEDFVVGLDEFASKGTAALLLAIKAESVPEAYRARLRAETRTWNALKAKAEKVQPVAVPA